MVDPYERLSEGRDSGLDPSDAGVGGVADDRPSQVSLIHLLNVVLRHWRLVVGLPLGLALAFTAVALVLPTRYTATASFIPQDGNVSTSRLAGLASQLGFAVPGAPVGYSPEFYATLLTSREILLGAVTSEYEGSAEDGASGPRPLVELLDLSEEGWAARLEEAMEWLEDALRVRISETTGMVTLSLRTRSAALSTGIASRLLALLNEFNLETRQSQASAEREFVEARMAEAKQDLLAAENALQVFLQRNRRIENSPELLFERDRLQREVSLRQDVYAGLAQAYEQAKIDEVRDTPVITVVERPWAPVDGDPRPVLRLLFLGLFVGLVVAVAVAAGREFSARSVNRQTDEYRQFEELRQQVVDDATTWFRKWQTGSRKGSTKRGAL